MLRAIEEEKDLGHIKFGSIHNFEYEIENVLEKDMKIDKVRVSCSSCTTATMPKKVKGKDKVTMNVTFKPGLIGNTTKWIEIMYDNDQVLRVNFKAIIDE